MRFTIEREMTREGFRYRHFHVAKKKKEGCEKGTGKCIFHKINVLCVRDSHVSALTDHSLSRIFVWNKFTKKRKTEIVTKAWKQRMI